MIVLVGLLSLSIIVTVHEFGHYLFARFFSVTVHEFAIGVGPVLYARQGTVTLFTLRALPLGGFCKLESIRESSSDTPLRNRSEPVEFTQGSLFSVSLPKKLAILAGGIITNILFFFLLNFCLFLLSYKEEALPTTIDPIPGFIAESAGLEMGDQITHIDSSPVSTFTELSSILSENAGKEVNIEFLRNAQEENRQVQFLGGEITRNAQKESRQVQLNSESPFLGIRPFIPTDVVSVQPQKKASLLGIEAGDRITLLNNTAVFNVIDYLALLQDLAFQTVTMQLEKPGGSSYTVVLELEGKPLTELGIVFPQYKSKKWKHLSEFLQDSFLLAFRILEGTFNALLQLISFNATEVTKNASGPVRLVSAIGSSTLDNLSISGLGPALLHFIRITALISLAIGIFNLLPIPLLDGGHMLFHAIYAFRKKTPSYRAMFYYSTVGALLLLSLFVLIIINDVAFLIQ